MKVHYKKALCGYSGTSDEAVYYYHPQLKLSLVREYVRPKDSTATSRIKLIMANLKLINPSVGYKQNFRDYLFSYNNLKAYQDKPMLTWNNLYLKLLFALEKADSRVDLTTLTREQIYDQNLPCKTVADAIAAGLLPVVDNYTRLTNLI